MEDPEDLSMSRLELCSYRYLQQMAKSYGFPSNVKKMYLIEMINAKKYSSQEVLDTIVARIKEQRRQLLRVRKPTKRKKKFLQGAEISSTSNQSSSRASDYIITYPPSPNRQVVTKYRPSNILHSTIAKKTIESDRVLRSFNNKMRRDYSVFNANNSFVRVIRAQKSVQRRQEVLERQYAWNVAFKKHAPFNINECPVQKNVPESYEEFSRQNFNVLGNEERQLVPVPRSFNISPKPLKSLRRLSGIYPLKPPEQAHYQYLPSVEFRRQDGRISKINAMVPTAKHFTNTHTSTLRQLSPQISNVSHDVRPNCSKTKDVEYNIDSDSSTESAIDSGTDRECFSVQKNKNFKTYAGNRNCTAVSLIRHTNSSSVVPESLGKYGESGCATEKLNKYTQYRRQTVDTANKPENSVITVTAIPMENKSYATKNQTKHGNRRFFTVNRNRPQSNRSLLAVNANRQTEDDFAPVNASSYLTNNSRAIDNQNRQTEGHKKTIENTNRYIDSESRMHVKPNWYVESRNRELVNQNRYFDSMNQSSVNLIRDNENEYWATNNLIRYEEPKRCIEPYRQTDIRTSVNRYTEIENDSIDNTNGYTNTVNHPIENTRGYTVTVNHPIDNTRRYTDTANRPIDNTRRYTDTANLPIDNTRQYTDTANLPIDNTRRYTDTANLPIDNTRRYTETINHPKDNTRGYTETVNEKNFNQYVGTGCNITDYRNTITDSRSFSKTPMIYTESRNYIEIPRSVEIDNGHNENINTNNEQTEIWNVARNYSNMSALTDVYPENQANEQSMNTSYSVFYHKNKRAEVRTQRSYTPQDRPTDTERLPRIADAFSHFNNAQYRSLTQPLYVQVSEESERLMSPSVKGGIVLEQLYNLTGRLLTTSNEPLLQIATTNSTISVYSTHVITSAEARSPATAGNDYNTHPFERDSQQYNMDSGNVPRLYDYLRMAEQERNYIKCDEVLSSSDSSFGKTVTSSQQGANVTIPEMVEDALELISQDGDYMERIGMDERMKCFECDWAGPKIILEYHFKEQHLSSIADQPSSRWVTRFALGALRGCARAVSRACGRLYVLAAGVKGGTLMAVLTVLPKASEEIPQYCRLTTYNKVTGEPYSWEGEIPYLPDTELFHEEINGLKLDITSLNLLPNSANLKLIDGELVANSTSKAIVGQAELDDIEIDIHVQIFD